MLTALIILVFAVSALALILLAVVVAGIRREHAAPPNCTAARRASIGAISGAGRCTGATSARPDTDDLAQPARPMPHRDQPEGTVSTWLSRSRLSWCSASRCGCCTGTQV